MMWAFVCAIISIGLDQLTKFLIYGSASRSIIGNLLWFESTLNTGVAFSMFEGMSWLFIALSLVCSAVFVYLIISKRVFNKTSEKICLGFVLGGTLSNVIDRFIFGGVRDFIYLKFINFAIFNLADSAIVLGAIALCIILLSSSIKKDNK